MREYLICQSCDSSGGVVFLVYSLDDRRVREFSMEEMTAKILGRQIDNAKLENSVVKITDSRHVPVRLGFEEKNSPKVFYILSEYTSELGSDMLSVVSNTGEIYELSRNMAAEFFENRQLVNGYMTKKGLKVINVPVFTTTLHKSLEHTDIH